jgi:hypothetical protein
MPVRCRTSVKIAPGVQVNRGKEGVSSVRVGSRRAGTTIGQRGVNSSVNIGGDLGYQTRPKCCAGLGGSLLALVALVVWRR